MAKKQTGRVKKKRAGTGRQPRAPDTLSGPILRMSKLFPGDTLPRVARAQDIHALAKDLKERQVPVGKGEEALLTRILLCLLRLKKGRSKTQKALTGLAALVFAIIEDDDLYIPESASLPGTKALKALAAQLRDTRQETIDRLEAVIEVLKLRVEHSRDLAAIRRRVPADRLDEELEAVLTKLGIHLEQGERIFAGHTDEARRAKHQARLEMAYRRASFLLARLLAVTPQADHPVLRTHVVRREHKHVEIDALGAERINEKQQARATKEFLAWTEEDLGEELTDENKDALAARLAEAASQGDEDEDGDWFFGME